MNLHTLHLEHIWLLAVYSLLMIANSRLQKGMPGVHSFVMYNVLALAGAIAVALRGSIPHVVSVVGGNTFVLAAYLVLFFSMSRTFGFRRSQTIVASVIFGGGALAMLQWGAFTPDSEPRLFAYSLTLALLQLQTALFLLVGGGAARRRVSWTLGSMLLALMAANLFRMVLILTQGVPDDYMQSGFALSVIVLANTCLQCGLVVAYIWMSTAMLRRDLEVQATTDPLTGLLNRRALEAAAERELRLAHLGGVPLSAVVIDLDDYKRINDQLGHAAGDATLQAVAKCLKVRLRPHDVLARTGGDEFVALFPRTHAAQAVDLAEGLRGCLQALELGLADPSLRITGSFGVAETAHSELWDELVQRCDGALYEVKRTGGNQVISRSAETPPAAETPLPAHAVPNSSLDIVPDSA